MKVGIDILEIDRLEQLLHDSLFLSKVLSGPEQEIYNNYGIKRQRSFLGGRFCAKEALYKAFGSDFADYSHVVILNDEQGRPYVRNYPKIEISIAHERHYALAIASGEADKL